MGILNFFFREPEPETEITLLGEEESVNMLSWVLNNPDEVRSYLSGETVQEGPEPSAETQQNIPWWKIW